MALSWMSDADMVQLAGSLAKEMTSQSNVHMVDVNESAVELAQENAEVNPVSIMFHIYQSLLL